MTGMRVRRHGSWIWALPAILAIPATPAAAQQGGYYPVFCQGISVDGGDNRMFVSSGFLYPLEGAPQSPTVQDSAIAKAFAQEVKRVSGKTLLDQSCYTRANADELQSFIASTKGANSASWTVAELDWMPKGARRLDADMATLTLPPGGPGPADKPARDDAATARAEAAAAREAEAARLAAERAAAAAKDAAQLQALNASQLEAAEAQRRKIEADKRAFAAKQKAYEDSQKAYAAAMARHQAEVQAAADARAKWEADVAACQAGDLSHCAPPTGQ